MLFLPIPSHSLSLATVLLLLLLLLLLSTTILSAFLIAIGVLIPGVSTFLRDLFHRIIIRCIGDREDNGFRWFGPMPNNLEPPKTLNPLPPCCPKINSLCINNNCWANPTGIPSRHWAQSPSPKLPHLAYVKHTDDDEWSPGFFPSEEDAQYILIQSFIAHHYRLERDSRMDMVPPPIEDVEEVSETATVPSTTEAGLKDEEEQDAPPVVVEGNESEAKIEGQATTSTEENSDHLLDVKTAPGEPLTKESSSTAVRSSDVSSPRSLITGPNTRPASHSRLLNIPKIIITPPDLKQELAIEMALDTQARLYLSTAIITPTSPSTSTECKEKPAFPNFAAPVLIPVEKIVILPFGHGSSIPHSANKEDVKVLTRGAEPQPTPAPVNVSPVPPPSNSQPPAQPPAACSPVPTVVQAETARATQPNAPAIAPARPVPPPIQVYPMATPTVSTQIVQGHHQSVPSIDSVNSFTLVTPPLILPPTLPDPLPVPRVFNPDPLRAIPQPDFSNPAFHHVQAPPQDDGMEIDDDKRMDTYPPAWCQYPVLEDPDVQMVLDEPFYASHIDTKVRFVELDHDTEMQDAPRSEGQYISNERSFTPIVMNTDQPMDDPPRNTIPPAFGHPGIEAQREPYSTYEPIRIVNPYQGSSKSIYTPINDYYRHPSRAAEFYESAFQHTEPYVTTTPPAFIQPHLPDRAVQHERSSGDQCRSFVPQQEQVDHFYPLPASQERTNHSPRRQGSFGVSQVDATYPAESVEPVASVSSTEWPLTLPYDPVESITPASAPAAVALATPGTLNEVINPYGAPVAAEPQAPGTPEWSPSSPPVASATATLLPVETLNPYAAPVVSAELKAPDSPEWSPSSPPAAYTELLASNDAQVTLSPPASHANLNFCDLFDKAHRAESMAQPSQPDEVASTEILEPIPPPWSPVVPAVDPSPPPYVSLKRRVSDSEFEPQARADPAPTQTLNTAPRKIRSIPSSFFNRIGRPDLKGDPTASFTPPTVSEVSEITPYVEDPPSVSFFDRVNTSKPKSRSVDGSDRPDGSFFGRKGKKMRTNGIKPEKEAIQFNLFLTDPPVEGTQSGTGVAEKKAQTDCNVKVPEPDLSGSGPIARLEMLLSAMVPFSKDTDDKPVAGSPSPRKKETPTHIAPPDLELTPLGGKKYGNPPSGSTRLKCRPLIRSDVDLSSVPEEMPTTSGGNGKKKRIAEVDIEELDPLPVLEKVIKATPAPAEKKKDDVVKAPTALVAKKPNTVSRTARSTKRKPAKPQDSANGELLMGQKQRRRRKAESFI